MVFKTLKYFSLIAISLLVTALILLPVYFYFIEFNNLSKYSWNNDQSWANFGSFIGGTVGPVLSFIAILLVLASWREQRRLQEAVEIQKLIFHDLGEITRILNTEIGTPTHTFLPKTFREVTRNNATNMLRSKGKTKKTVFYNLNSKKYAFAVREHVRHICWCFDRYQKLGGNVSTIKSYKNRICVDIMFIYSLYDYQDAIVEKHFDVEAMTHKFMLGASIEEIWDMQI